MYCIGKKVRRTLLFLRIKQKGKVELTIIESKCRCGYFKKGEKFIVDDLCPPLCHELWNSIYPSVYVLINGGDLDYRETSKNV